MSGGEAARPRVAGLDLNLLVPLQALLEERSVTRAAARLRLSQPTLSTALARLRRHFGDELLARVGNNYELTPLAVDLLPRVSALLEEVDSVLLGRPAFDPHSSDRTYSVLASDYVIAVLGRQLATALRERAPGVTLRLELLNDGFLAAAEQTLRGIDGVVLPHGFLTDVPQQRLFTDEWVCVASPDNPEVGDIITMEQLATLPLVLSHWRSSSGYVPVIRQLEDQGLAPRVEIVAESFLALPFLVSGTDRIGLLHTRLADRIASAAGVRVVRFPFTATPIVEAFWWHPLHDRDPAHAWLREVMRDVCAELDGG